MVETSTDTVWTVVKVWRGFAERADVFASRSEARRLYSRLRRQCNFDEEDVEMFETRIIKSAAARGRRSPR